MIVSRMSKEPGGRINRNAAKSQDAYESFSRVMADDRKYDQLNGPNRILERFERTLKECAIKGRELKIKHYKQNFNYSSFADEPPSVQPIKFDHILSREKAIKPFLRIPEGAPFWKYTVKDDVITVPVKVSKFSENPASSHTHPYEITKQLDHFQCGRLDRKIKTLQEKYETLA